MSFNWSETITGKIKFSHLTEIRTNVDSVHNNLACTSQLSVVHAGDNASALNSYDSAVCGSNYAYCASNYSSNLGDHCSAH